MAGSRIYSRRRFIVSGSAGVAGALAVGRLWGEAASGSPRHAGPVDASSTPLGVSGVLPELAMFNNEQECGTGAVAVWAGRLWAITYGPHAVRGSSDKLYEITRELRQVARPESVGGTHANRMIHLESEQLFIGSYVIGSDRQVRVIPRNAMPGRLTGTARHVQDPADRVHFATMEEGLYSVDVQTLEVFGHIKDGNEGGITSPANPATISSSLPGYHGKGLYAGQGRLVYSNNGDSSAAAMNDPTAPSGALAEWTGEGDWSMVRRNQFTEVSGPGGIEGDRSGGSDPVWSIGWDFRSLILMVLHDGGWHSYRLPKASHCYDGGHGWHTEWPRIRDIGESDLLMTMHGTMWRFPEGFTPQHSAGIAPRSTYLRVVGDFTRWGEKVVLGCDDTAVAEFNNKRRHKGNIVGPGQSQSNLWFVEPGRLDQLGTSIGDGAVWLDEPVTAEAPSDPFLFSGYQRRGLHLTHGNEDATVTFTVEVDRDGDGSWRRFRPIRVRPGSYRWVHFPAALPGTWVRLRTDRDCPTATAWFTMSDVDRRDARPAAIFDGLARLGTTAMTGGIVRARGANLRTLAFVADRPASSPSGGPEPVGYYELDGDLAVRRVDDPDSDRWHRDNVAIPSGMIEVDDASVLVIDDDGRRWRLPRGDPAFDFPGPLGPERLDREVCTERDLFNAHGTFYELPAENSGGFAKIRPIATHNMRITDYCSYRGLIVISGVDDAARGERIVRSDDGRTALWVGVVDDLWGLGIPRGTGGPWAATAVRAGQPSDPYLMRGYQDKMITLSHSHDVPVTVTVQVDVSGDGPWCTYRRFEVEPGQHVEHRFPDAFSAYWVRCVADADCTATARLSYGPNPNP